MCLNIGDGTTPRTAGLMAYLTQWHSVSIDPMLKEEWCGYNPQEVRNLYGVRDTFEGWMEDLHTGKLTMPFSNIGTCFDILILVGVHAHNQFRGPADMGKLRERFGYPETVLVSLPCCQAYNPENDLGRKPDVTYEDLCIFSAKRKVNIWRFPAGSPASCLPPR